MAKKNNHSGIVYSSEFGSMCPQCGTPLKQCRCKQKTGGASSAHRDGVIRVGRETKGRKGKGVTIISGVPLEFEALKLLAKKLKQKCGTGGTVKDGVIEIQGDHRDVLVEELSKQGYQAKRSGG